MKNKRKYLKEYYENHKEEIIEQHKNYNEQNKEKIAEDCKKYRENHKEKLSKQRKKYYEDNKEEFKKRNKKYNIENRRAIQKRNKKYIETHKQQVAIQQKKWRDSHRKYLNNKRKIKLGTNFGFKMKQSLRVRINQALKGATKSLSTTMLIGCEVDYLMYHIQNQFTKGMTWDNYGKNGWEIDHIKPCNKFDMTKPKEQAKCFHYTNLQPLWAKENRSKGDKYTP